MFVLDFDGAFDEFSNTTYGAVDEMIPEVMLYDPFVDVDEEDYELITTIVARLSNINDVDEIVIPDDVVANAIDESGASATE